LYGIYLCEEGEQRNNALVAHYLRLAADQGLVVTQYEYGRSLAKGLRVPTNKTLVEHYFKLAADQGYTCIRVKRL
jgi:TPR repeat protein